MGRKRTTTDAATLAESVYVRAVVDDGSELLKTVPIWRAFDEAEARSIVYELNELSDLQNRSQRLGWQSLAFFVVGKGWTSAMCSAADVTIQRLRTEDSPLREFADLARRASLAAALAAAAAVVDVDVVGSLVREFRTDTDIKMAKAIHEVADPNRQKSFQILRQLSNAGVLDKQGVRGGYTLGRRGMLIRQNLVETISSKTRGQS